MRLNKTWEVMFKRLRRQRRRG